MIQSVPFCKLCKLTELNMIRPSYLLRIAKQAIKQSKRYASAAAMAIRDPELELYEERQPISKIHIEEKTDSLYAPWEISKLTSESDVIEAQALLYQVYIKEMGWMFAKNNPTGFRIETSKCGKKLLTDDLESHSVFFGAKYQDQIVAVMRTVHYDKNGNLDLTRYESSKKPAIQKLVCPSNNPNLIELQRCVVLKPYRGTSVWPCLFHYIFLDVFQRNFSIIGTGSVDKMRNFVAATLKFQIVDDNFLYSENMEGPSTCLYLPSNKVFRSVQILEEIIRRQKLSKAIHKT